MVFWWSNGYTQFDNQNQIFYDPVFANLFRMIIPHILAPNQ